jgi:hypothetical protein
LLFTRINPAAWLFAALFIGQALLLFRAGVRRHPHYLSFGEWEGVVGAGLIVYSLAYPFLTMAAGHVYPAMPTFGVPCPTATLTIGLLMTASRPIPVGLTVVVVFWAFVGGSAAVLLEVATDYVLLGAGVLLTAIMVRQSRRPVPATP